MWIKSSLIALDSLVQWLPQLRHRSPLKACTLVQAVFQLTLVDPATVSIIVGITITPMTGATGAAGR